MWFLLWMYVCLRVCAYVCHFHICTKQQTAQIVNALGYGIWSFILKLYLSEEKHYNKYKPWQLRFHWKSAEVGGGPCPMLYLLQISGEGGDMGQQQGCSAALGHCPEPVGRGLSQVTRWLLSGHYTYILLVLFVPHSAKVLSQRAILSCVCTLHMAATGTRVLLHAPTFLGGAGSGWWGPGGKHLQVINHILQNLCSQTWTCYKCLFI